MIFDLTNLNFSKQFKLRTWRINESFNDYYHDKIIKANEVPIPDDEVIDYVIDGIPNYQLRNHARLQNFLTLPAFLQAFKKITARAKR